MLSICKAGEACLGKLLKVAILSEQVKVRKVIGKKAWDIDAPSSGVGNLNNKRAIFHITLFCIFTISFTGLQNFPSLLSSFKMF